MVFSTLLSRATASLTEIALGKLARIPPPGRQLQWLACVQQFSNSSDQVERPPHPVVHGVMALDRRSSGSPTSSNGSPRRHDINAKKRKPFLIGVAGGTASGKTTVCDKIKQEVVSGGELGQIVTLSQDSFYRELTPEESAQAEKGQFDFDHPDAFDHKLMLQCLQDIHDSKKTDIPVYDFCKNARVKGQYKTIHPSDVVLVEGILVFYFPDVRKIFDLKLFVDTDADTRLARRVVRDIEKRGRSLENVLTQYITRVKPAFEEFCLPTKKFADVIIPRGADNTVAISLIAQHVSDLLANKPGNTRPTLASTLSAPLGHEREERLRHSSESDVKLRADVRPH